MKSDHIKISDLPAPSTQRWVVSRKALVVKAVRDGVIGRAEVLARYNITEEEFDSWIALIDRHGVRGLRTTRLQHYKPADTRIQQAAE